MTETIRARIPLLRPGLVLGIGLGAFVDGIVLHQLLQWHEMLSSVYPPVDVVSVKYNMVWDGVFHAFAWLVCAVGIGMMFAERSNRSAWSGRIFVGALVAGWGVFNLVEGVVDHLVLHIHHVHPGSHELAWDLGFITLGGAAVIALGVAILRSDSASRSDGDRRRMLVT